MSYLFPERSETERLELTALTADSVDATDVYPVFAGKTGEPMAEVTEYMPWEPHAHPKETLEFVESVTENRETETGTDYVIRPKAGEEGAGEFAGVGGVGVDWDRRVAEFGAWLRKPYWGRGYSGERAAAFVELAFEHLDLDLIEVDHVAGNEKSRRAIEKYTAAHGGGHDAHLRNWHPWEDGPVDAHIYTVTAEQYADSPKADERAILDLDWEHRDDRDRDDARRGGDRDHADRGGDQA